ncbi:6-phospho-3-hexuloisomerase [Alicyclobacillus fastidiosus]|uniref:6-phospho-3-hexuloisomerase n=1 Tax=Alicyclobacillus fastidiosus TaxID=392011 RepID=A0ABY6ZJ17_9BACL|nr:6-phospho-3-hexuloisomerase [Alicyclobacillus fastidiosus]WAH42913.1 6-phospho-3-hexuloisomerase [Alicyclobacillus fastidiosus]
MKTSQYATKILQELERVVNLIEDDKAEQFVEHILRAKKVFVAGAGRSGLMARAFAMRMMQMGFDSYVVGETVTPNLEKDDVLILGTGSGETKSLVIMAEKAKSLDASIAVATIFPESTIGQLADVSIKLPAQPKTGEGSGYTSIQPMGALFEQSLLVFYDAVILRLMENQGLDSDTMFSRHANLE